MAWRVAGALLQLKSEYNALFPDRLRVHDGSIGDAAHASRDSDHNPWITDPNGVGVVSALDLTEDNERGITEIIDFTFAQIIARRDPRVKYLIHEDLIMRSYPRQGIPAWSWAEYYGPNPHIAHGHISVQSDRHLYDNTASWGLSLPTPKTPIVIPKVFPVLRQGSKGKEVEYLQARLRQHGHNVAMDGDFGPGTKAAVVRHQRAWRIEADGVVGPATWPTLIAKGFYDK